MHVCWWEIYEIKKSNALLEGRDPKAAVACEWHLNESVSKWEFWFLNPTDLSSNPDAAPHQLHDIWQVFHPNQASCSSPGKTGQHRPDRGPSQVLGMEWPAMSSLFPSLSLQKPSRVFPCKHQTHKHHLIWCPTSRLGWDFYSHFMEGETCSAELMEFRRSSRWWRGVGETGRVCLNHPKAALFLLKGGFASELFSVGRGCWCCLV